MKIDLHTHTTASDGILTPYQLLEIAQKANISYLAITDHDTVKGVKEALAHKDIFKGKLIPGVEINVQDFQGTKMEILGYGINTESRLLNRLFERMKESRLIRGRLMVEALQNIGLNINWEDIMNTDPQGVIGRPHIGRALINLGYCHNLTDAFNRYIGRGCPGYVSRYKLPAKDIIDIIHQAGGIAILAHPLLSSHIPEKIEHIIKELVELGLDGFELFYDYSNYIKNNKIKESDYHLAKGVLKNIHNSTELLVSGGSDWHGELPNRLGTIEIPLEVIENLKKKLPALS